MLTLLIALTAATVAAPLLIRALGRPAFALLALVPLGGFIWIASLFNDGVFRDGGEIVAAYEWMPSTHLNLEFRLDALAGLFSLIQCRLGLRLSLRNDRGDRAEQEMPQNRQQDQDVDQLQREGGPVEIHITKGLANSNSRATTRQ